MDKLKNTISEAMRERLVDAIGNAKNFIVDEQNYIAARQFLDFCSADQLVATILKLERNVSNLRIIQFDNDVAIANWCGMIIGIEKDGYIHS